MRILLCFFDHLNFQCEMTPYYFENIRKTLSIPHGVSLILLLFYLAPQSYCAIQTLPQKKCRIGVLADKDLNNQPFFPLLETNLLQNGELDVVERQKLDLILEEQKISALGNPESCALRLEVGNLVHANLL